MKHFDYIEINFRSKFHGIQGKCQAKVHLRD